jgi:hypothetical protein
VFPTTERRFVTQASHDTGTTAQPRHLCGRACLNKKDPPMPFLALYGLAAPPPIITRLNQFGPVGFQG